jgi:hypothetical protein
MYQSSLSLLISARGFSQLRRTLHEIGRLPHTFLFPWHIWGAFGVRVKMESVLTLTLNAWGPND